MISLSLVGRTLGVVALVASIATAGSQLGWSIERLGQDPNAGGVDVTSSERRMLAFRLDAAEPTTFRFSKPVTQARLISHPIVAPGKALRAEAKTYSVFAELLDANGNVVARHEIFARTTLLERDGSRRPPLRRYRGSDEIVAPSDEARVANAKPFAAIRLVSGNTDPDIIAIDVRVSERRPLIASTAASAFLRYDSTDQIRLAAPNAFPPELLTAAERSNIAINQWRPVGPIGIDGREYRLRVLYEEQSESEHGDERLANPEDGE